MPILNIIAPYGGIVRRTAYQTQPPFSSYDSSNVWPIDAKTGRITCAVRPANVPFGSLHSQVNMLNIVNGISTFGPSKSFAAAYDGQIYYWNGTTMVTATGAKASSVNKDKYVSATAIVNKLAICDDTTAPILFDYTTGQAALLTATAGTVPEGASIASTWQGALWLVKGNVLYASRVGDYTDWDYSVSLTDLFGAFFTDGDYKGVLAGPITAVIPQLADTQIVCTVSGSLAMRGHPRQGGIFEAIGDQYALGQGAWCALPDNSIVMLTPLGLMNLSAQPNAVMTPISRDKIPDELVGVLYSVADPLVNLEYDPRWNQIHIYIRGPQEQAWLFDMNTGGYHKMEVPTYPIVTELFSDFTTESTSGLLLGGYDGIRRYDRFGVEDIKSSLVVGPLKISNSTHELSKVVNMRITFARDTPTAVGKVRIATGLDGQDAVSRLLSGTEQYSIDISKLTANNGMCYPSVTGHAMVVAFTTESGDVAIEEMSAEVIKMGRATFARSPQLSITGASTDFAGAYIELDPGIWSGYSEATPTEIPDDVLPDHTHFLDLSLMPSSWWDKVTNDDGSDIRVSNVANQEIPSYPVDFSKTGQTGMLIFRMSQSVTPRSVRVWCGNPDSSIPPASSAAGKDNIFDSYYRGFWYNGGGNSNLTKYADNTATANKKSGVDDALEYGNVAGPLGAAATNFDFSGNTYWLIDSWLTSQGLLSQVEWTFMAAMYRTNNFSIGDNLLSLTGNLSNEITLVASVDSSNATSTYITTNTTATNVLSGASGAAASNWRLHAGVTHSTTDRRSFVDGLHRTQVTTLKASPTIDDLVAGSDYGSPAYLKGRGALFQIHTTARSDAWIKFQGAMMDQTTFWGTIGAFTLVNPVPVPSLDAGACPSGIIPVTETGTWAGYDSATPANPSSGSVAQFTHLVDLSAMSSDWWSNVESDGSDIRVTNVDNNFLPMDLIEFDSTAQTGLLVFRRSQQQGAPSTVRIWVGNSSAVNVSKCASYGQYFAYDSNWVGFWPSGSGNDRTQYLNHMTDHGNPSILESNSPVNSKTTYFDNELSTLDYCTADNIIPAVAPYTLVASVKHPTGATHQNAVIVCVQDDESQSGVFLSTATSATPARLTTRNNFGTSISAGNSKTITPDAYWLEAGTAYGNVSRLSYADDNTGDSYSPQGVVVLSGLNSINIAAENAAAPINGWTGTICLVSAHKAARGEAWLNYWNASLDQSTFWSTWTWTASSTSLG